MHGNIKKMFSGKQGNQRNSEWVWNQLIFWSDSCKRVKQFARLTLYYQFCWALYAKTVAFNSFANLGNIKFDEAWGSGRL